MVKRTDEQMQEELNKLWDKAEQENPYETFEPHPGEEGVFSIEELYEARLRKVVVMEVLHGPDKELANYIMRRIAGEIRKGRH